MVISGYFRLRPQREPKGCGRVDESHGRRKAPNRTELQGSVGLQARMATRLSYESASYQRRDDDVDAGAEPGGKPVPRPRDHGLDEDSQSVTKPSATLNASSSMAKPVRRSASLMFSGGTTWIRLKFTKGSMPAFFKAPVTAAIAGEDPP